MTPGRIALLIGGILSALVGLALVVAGAGALWFSTSDQDSDGFLTSPAYEVSSQGFAVTTAAADLVTAPEEWVPWAGRINTKLTVTTATGTPLFVGVGPADDVTAYLDGVAHSRITDLEDLGTEADGAVVVTVEGTAPSSPPGDQTFWVDSAQGTGTQELQWNPTSGRWSAVLMNADGSAGIDMTASGGITASLLTPIGAGLLVAGVFLLIIAVVLTIVATAGSSQDMHRGLGEPVPATPAGHGVYPVVVEGFLDEPLSRGLWLVKWLLAIPHYVVLAFLWTAFCLLTLVAGVAILFTGRYPRPIFDFNVGVLRWTWRVSFYSYSVLGTDTYPPFSLAAGDYPATFDVEYPQRLSRGLVLVKWWLLAIPHFLVLAFLVGGAASWSLGSSAGDNWQVAASGGLIGVLAFIAGAVVLITARYPRGLFDFTMGLNRWVYRVLAYVALMTDEYPPFRLDSGGSEPKPATPSPVGPPDRTASEQLARK